MGRRGDSPEFRRKVLDLINAGRKVDDVARDLGISSQTIYNWRRQDRIDRGLEPGLSSGERAELLTARRRIAELETELKIARRAAELLKDVKPPKVRYATISVMAADKLPVIPLSRLRIDCSIRASLCEGNSSSLGESLAGLTPGFYGKRVVGPASPPSCAHGEVV